MKSRVARGAAAEAREYGQKRGVDGFEIGGRLRQEANAIIHAPPGEARKYADRAEELCRKAHE